MNDSNKGGQRKLGTSRQVLRIVVDPEHFGETVEQKTACKAGLEAEGVTTRADLQEYVNDQARDLLGKAQGKGAEILERQNADDRLERIRAACVEIGHVTGKEFDEIADYLLHRFRPSHCRKERLLALARDQREEGAWRGQLNGSQFDVTEEPEP